jgi:hypothetical protein
VTALRVEIGFSRRRSGSVSDKEEWLEIVLEEDLVKVSRVGARRELGFNPVGGCLR